MRLLIVTSIILHTLDIQMTLLCGGLPMEGNPIAAYIWAKWGLLPIVLGKLVSVGVFALVWKFYDLMPSKIGRWFKSVLSSGLIGILIFTIVRNYILAYTP